MALCSFLFWKSLHSTSHRFALELMYALLFSCCGLRHRPHEPSGERTPLIPQSDDTPTPQPRVIDHQKFKERLGSVVRSKEGKMVNVNAQFPFNLHSQEHPEGSSGRSSRNVSGGTLPSSRAASPSPRRSLHKAPSITSFRPDGEDIPPYLPLVAHPSVPILNVRLVKAPRSTQSTRGRSQRSRDPSSRTQVPDSQLAADRGHTHSPALGSEEHPPTHPPVDPETPPYHENFSIHDAGAVARSWGD